MAFYEVTFTFIFYLSRTLILSALNGINIKGHESLRTWYQPYFTNSH